MNSGTSRLVRLTLSLVVTVGFGIATAKFYGRRGSDGPIAKVKLAGSAPRDRILVHVTTFDGKPAAGIGVASQSGSGTDEAVTGRDGLATIQPGESEVLALLLEEVEIWKSPYKDTLFESILSPSRGLRMRVMLKQNHPGHAR